MQFSLAFHDQFEKYSHGEIDKMNTEYNYNSIMHYSKNAFGKRGRITIEPIDPSKTVGNTDGRFSPLDIVELNALYDCTTNGKRLFEAT